MKRRSMRAMPAELQTQTKEFALVQRSGNMALGFSKPKSHKGTYKTADS